MTRLPAILAIVLLLPTACATTAQTTGGAGSTSAHDDSRLTLGLGQSTQLSDGSRLSYTSLINDSRCAPDVQCIWAGDAEIALRWSPAKASEQTIRLHTTSRGGATSARIGQRTLTLVSLEPGIGPEATLSINDAP